MNYRKAVAEARQLIKRSEADQWRLAELTSEVLAGGKSTREWAADVGVSQAHVVFLGKIWTAHGDYPVIDRPAFADAYAEAKGMNPDRSERRLGEAMSNLTKATPERRAAAATQLLSDPAVIHHMAQDEKGLAAVQRVDAQAKEYQEMGELRVREGLKPLRKGFGNMQETVDPVMSMFSELAKRMTEITNDDIDIDPEDWSMIRHHWKKITEELEVYSLRRSLPSISSGVK